VLSYEETQELAESGARVLNAHVVGEGINASYANLRRGTAALVEVDAAPRGVSTSSFRITWLVPRDKLQQAVRALHAALVPAEGPPVP
jgi:aspartate kinase